MHLAWHVAALGRVAPKKFPKLDKILVKIKQRGKPRQTMAQQIAIAHMWAGLGYGRIKTTKSES